MKKLCPIHYFNYSGSKCPFCEQDRINSMVHKFHKSVISLNKENVKKENKDITIEDIEKLKNKFNCR